MARVLGSGLLALSVAALSAAASISAQAASPGPNVIVPASSIEKPSDIGKRMHTNFVLLKSVKPSLVNPDTLPGTESPTSLRTIYNIPSTALGQGGIAIVDAYIDASIFSDFNTYCAAAGLPVETSKDPYSSSNKVFTIVYQKSNTTPPPDPEGTTGWNIEEALDTELAHGMAPNAKIWLVMANSNQISDLIAAEVKAKTQPGVTEVSNSWGGGEFSFENSYNNEFKENGVSFFASSGDDGPGIEFPACCITVVGVGGTTINRDDNGNFTSETAWDGAGGGLSAYETSLHYQQINTNAESVVGSKRGVPDIASEADPNTGVGVYSGDIWYQVGGTSVASPTIAAEVNDANKDQASSYAVLSNIYAHNLTSAFRDITSGDSRAVAGYDLVTGVGTPNGLAGL